MLKYDIQRAQAVSHVFTAQELDWILESLPGEAAHPTHQRILDVLSEAFAVALDRVDSPE
jgi:hypothetical protein